MSKGIINIAEYLLHLFEPNHIYPTVDFVLLAQF